MESIQHPTSYSMYAQPTIRFRDPFVSQHSHRDSGQSSWSSYPQSAPHLRSITPPPEMNGVSHPVKPIHYEQEHGYPYGVHQSGQQVYRTAQPPYPSRDVYQPAHSTNDPISHPVTRAISPTDTRTNTQRENSAAPTSRRNSVVNTGIAASIQVPRSVNESGGSLSELASQITCLFWFESADLLQAVEDSDLPIFPPRQLVSDAKPSTGFRKWVTTILSTTVVAQNVVILALLFIYRLKKLNPSVRGKPGSEYRLLTVALMLGNKFLDDNTYTNKTWAEVSGITVSEVHIMEVEFLSNMKYCLYTSAEDWAKWQTLLGRFATFFDRASKPITQPTAPILPPTSSLYLPGNLPSPPASTQASPPYGNDQSQGSTGSSAAVQNGLTPAPSPLGAFPEAVAAYQIARKRSRDEQSTEPAPKRVASSYQSYTSPPRAYPGVTPQQLQNQQAPRLPLPSLAIPATSASAPSYVMPVNQSHQLPPMNVSSRAMAMVYPNANTQPQPQHLTATSAGVLSQPHSQMTSQYQSRQQSPFSATASPTNAAPLSATSLHPPAQVSPSYFLQQRNSPYRPVHNVSTLLYPPPSSTMHHRSQSIEHNQMHYQPLGKPMQERQSGRLPYVMQNMWLTENQNTHTMTPVHQWPGFK